MPACEGIMISVEEGTEDVKEKLQMCLDLWALQKEQLEDDIAQARRAGKQTEYALTYELAKLNVSLNSEKHRTYLAECKLDDATVKIEDLQEKVVYYKKVVQKEEDRQCQQKVQELQKLLEVAESCHKQEIKVLQENYEKKMDESNLRFQSITHAVKEKEEQLNNARHLIKQLQGKLEESVQTRDDSIIQVTVANLELSELRVEAGFLKDKIAALEEHGSPATIANVQILQDVVKQKELEIERLSKDIGVKERAFQDLSSEKVALHDQLELSRKELQEGKELAEKNQKEAAVAEKGHKKSLNELEKQLTAATKLVTKKEHALQKLTEQLEELLQEKIENKKVEENYSKLLKDMEEKCTEAARLVDEKNKLFQDLTKRFNEVLKEVEHLKMQCLEYEIQSKEEKFDKVKFEIIEEQYITAAKAVETKDEKLKEVMRLLEALQKDNETLSSKCLKLGGIEEQLAEAHTTHKMKVEELEEQYSVANTLVTKLDKKIKRLTQKLEESENTFATVENQHSKAMEMNKIKLTEIGQRCNESTKLVNDKEILLKEVKQKLEDMQKENERLKQQITEQEHVRKSSEQEIGVENVPVTNKGKPKAFPASSRKPLAEVPSKDATNSKGGAPPRRRSKQLPKESGATNLENRLEQAVDTSIDGNPAQTSGDEEENDSGVSEPTPKNKLTKKRPRKATEEAMDRTPPAKRKPPRSTRKLTKAVDKGGPILLPAQLLVGSTPLPLKPNAPSIPARRKLGSFSGSLPR